MNNTVNTDSIGLFVNHLRCSLAYLLLTFPYPTQPVFLSPQYANVISAVYHTDHTNTVAMYQFIGTSKQHLCAEECICRFNTTRKNIFILVSSISVHGGQHWAHLGTVCLSWAPCCPHEHCCQGTLFMKLKNLRRSSCLCEATLFCSAYSVFTASDHLISHQIDGVDPRK